MQINAISFRDKIKDYSGLSTTSWARLSDQPGQNPRKAEIFVNTDKTFQQFQGTGAAFSEIGGKCLLQLNDEDRETVLEKLFDVNSGAGFNNCRLPIGSSDFALSAYSLNDHAGDFEMKYFSLDRDYEYLIPYIKGAMTHAPELRIHASPWSPPAWLKTSGKFVEGGSLMDEDKVYAAYATYLGKFINGYAKEGIDINKLLIQNEPDSASNFPTCIMEPDQMAMFAKEYLKPEFDKENIEAEIWAGTFRTITGFQAREFMDKGLSADIVKGLGFQYALTEHISDLKRTYPDVRIMHTETPCYRGENTWEQAIALFNHFINYMNVGSEIFSYWNMILDEKSESTWGWKQNSLVTVKDNSEVIYNPDFYVMEMLSKNIRPGAYRIECLCLVKQSIAFKNPDGSIVVFICNLNDQDIDSVISIDGKEHQFSLQGSSIVSIKL